MRIAYYKTNSCIMVCFHRPIKVKLKEIIIMGMPFNIRNKTISVQGYLSIVTLTSFLRYLRCIIALLLKLPCPRVISGISNSVLEMNWRKKTHEEQALC